MSPSISGIDCYFPRLIAVHEIVTHSTKPRMKSFRCLPRSRLEKLTWWYGEGLSGSEGFKHANFDQVKIIWLI